MKLFAFVLMPFTKRFDKRYDAIERAIRGAEMAGDRVDKQSFHSQGITHRVLQQIENADVIIADVSTNNPNVLYEVGYAYAKAKLSILLTNDPTRIPFDLKDKRHVVFSGLEDLEKKLSRELKALAVEVDMVFDGGDAECVAQVPVSMMSVTGTSNATSIRVKVTTTSEVGVPNVFAQMIRVKRRSRKGE